MTHSLLIHSLIVGLWECQVTLASCTENQRSALMLYAKILVIHIFLDPFPSALACPDVVRGATAIRYGTLFSNHDFYWGMNNKDALCLFKYHKQFQMDYRK